jgi:sulfatase modifying factor 1
MRAAHTIGFLAWATCAIAACELAIDPNRLDSQFGDAADVTPDVVSDTSIDALPFDGGCPGHAGPAMVRVGSFCIDSTEVRNADYVVFLQADGGGAFHVPACAWKSNYDHDAGWTPLGTAQWPATNLDWCDAYVYCLWAGKRLCGDPSGGPAAYLSWADSAHDQWYAACSGDAGAAYPYGAIFDENACDGRLADGGFPEGAATYSLEPVASRASCQGTTSGVYDLSGNAAEWEDCCDPSSSSDAADQTCRIRGGSANSDSARLRCDAPSSFPNPYGRRSLTDDLGFRCCAP